MTNHDHDERVLNAEEMPTGLSRIGNQLSRRRLLKMALGAGAIAVTPGLLAACGGDDDDSESTSESDTGASDETEAASEETSTEAEGAETEASGGEETEAAGDEGTSEEDAADEGGSTPTEELNCAEGGTLTFALSSDPPNMDPHVSTGTAADYVKVTLYNGLMRYWSGGELEPDLAENVEISDDGLTYTVTLKEATFHNGEPLTSADVKASYERILDEATGATFIAQLSPIESVDTPDDRTAVLNLANPSAPLLSYLGAPDALILSSKFLEGGGDPDTETIGTGPFKLDQHEPGVRIVVVKNEEYFWDGFPYLDSIEFIPYPDENTRMAAAKSGEVMMADYVPWKDYQSIRDDDKLKLYSGDAAAFMTVMYHTEKEPFNDPKVRYALGFAYDRQAIIDIVFFGEGSPITGGLVPPGLWGHADQLDGTFSYDPEKAKQLLADAGYPDGFDCTLMSTSQYGMHQGTAEIAQQGLRDIGVRCELELFDWPTTVEKYAKGDYHFRIHGLGTGGFDPDSTLAQYFDSESPAATSIAFANDEVDKLLADARALTDQAERKKLYDQVQKLILDLSPHSFLTYRVQSEVSLAEVGGYEHYPAGLGFYSGKSLEKTQIGCE